MKWNGYAALPQEQNEATDTGRYGTKKFSALLPEVQIGKFD